MTFPVEQVWNEMLAQASAVDLCAGITDASINAFLNVHHRAAGGYAQEITKRFTTGTGEAREFVVQIVAQRPFEIDIHPFTGADSPGGPWNDVPAPVDLPTFVAPKPDSQQPNIRLKASSVGFRVSWPKLSDPTQSWTFPEDDASGNPQYMVLDMDARAFIALSTEETGANQSANQPNYHRAFLTIYPTHARFSRPLDELRKVISAAIPVEALAEVGDATPAAGSCDEKFEDLIIILLNIIAGEFAPRVMQRVEIPTPIFTNMKITPAALALQDDFVALGVAIDTIETTAALQKQANMYVDGFWAAVELDFANSGGFSATVLDEQHALESAVDAPPRFRAPGDVRGRMPLTRAYMEAMRTGSEASRSAAPSTSGVAEGSAETRGTASAETMQFYGAVRQGFINQILASLMPGPTSHCSDWLDLAAVRGRACYWAKLMNPHVEILDDGGIRGGVDIDAGAGLETCVRKFWDCSWRWSCGSFGVRASGGGGIDAYLASGSGIELAMRNPRLPGLSSYGVPVPFNYVVDAILGLFHDFLQLLADAVLRLIHIRISPPKFEPKGEAWWIQMRYVGPFRYVRPEMPTSDTQNFLGVYVAATLDVKPPLLLAASDVPDAWVPVLGVQPEQRFVLLRDDDPGYEARGKRGSQAGCVLELHVAATNGQPAIELDLTAALAANGQTANVHFRGSVAGAQVDTRDPSARVTETNIAGRLVRTVTIAGFSQPLIVDVRRGRGKRFEVGVKYGAESRISLQGYVARESFQPRSRRKQRRKP